MSIKESRNYFWMWLIFVLVALNFKLHSQVYNGTGGAIPDNGTAVFSQNISGLPSKLSPNYGLVSIKVDLTHTYLQNLTIQLMSPDGTLINLAVNCGGSSDNFTNTIFTDTSNLPIQSISNSYAPYTGYFKPKDTLGNINNFSNGNGTWRLYIKDDALNDQGYLNSWHLTFGTQALKILDTFSSNLPVVCINTYLNAVTKDSSVESYMKVIDNGSFIRNRKSDSLFQFLGKIRLRTRGNQSLNFPQRSFSFKLKNDTDDDTSVSILNMPKESDWILMNTWNDRSMVRNPLMYHLYDKMGHYATRSRYCEVFIDGKYEGIYQLTERIKRDEKRIDIAKLKETDLAGDSLTGGYIFKHDLPIDLSGWISAVAPPACPNNYARFQYVYPDSNSIKVEQTNYIKSYVEGIENAFFNIPLTDTQYGYRKFIDINSFADYLICNEFAWNGDGFTKSMVFYKDKDSKNAKLFAGPVWDFDWSLKKMPWLDDSISFLSHVVSPCNYQQATLPWHSILMEDEYFRNTVRCRYENFRTSILSQSYIHHVIDSLESITNEAQIRHYSRWPTWGQSLGTPETHLSLSMEEELDTLKAMIGRRLISLDKKLPGVCNSTELSSVQDDIPKMMVYPNPTRERVHLEIQTQYNDHYKITLFNTFGQVMLTDRIISQIGINRIALNTETMAPGLYYLHIEGKNGVKISRKLCIIE